MASKEDIRSSRRLHRRTLLPDLWHAAGESHCTARDSLGAASPPATSATFAVYLGVAFEPPTMPLIKALHDAGHRVLLPVCEPGRELSWVYWTPGQSLSAAAYAPIDEPEGERLESSVVAGAAGIFMPGHCRGPGWQPDRPGRRLLRPVPSGPRRFQPGGRPPSRWCIDDDLLPSGPFPPRHLTARCTRY